MFNICYCLLIIVVLLNNYQAYDFRYHSYSEMSWFLHDIAARFPTKAALFEIGKSEGGRSLWAMALSLYSPHEHILLRPETKYIGNMHGNEVVGLEMLIYLIEYLLTSDDDQVRQIMSRSRIWIMPSMNPDGLELSQYGDCSSTQGRYTLNNIDLNRNFPDYLGVRLQSSRLAKETSAIMSWMQAIPFVLSANYHGGAFAISIPYDRHYDGRSSKSTDDDIYQSFAKSYANRLINTNQYCPSSEGNRPKVTRGADWYDIAGGMQDYGYLNYGTIEMTMEISCCKYPDERLLISYWNANRDAMIELLFQAQRGVKGLILDEYYQPIPFTQVMIDDRQPVVNVSPLGEFWRILLPGSYILKVFYRGYEIHHQPIMINDIYIPLNLTIIIPRSIFSSYSKKSIRNLSLFSTNSTGKFSFSYFLFNLTLICIYSINFQKTE